MKHKISHIACALCAVVAATQVGTNDATCSELSPTDLLHMSLDELSNIQVTSVSKKAEPLSKAAAAVYVITNEDIRRYGATTIPEALRLAPNLQVARVNARDYAITARGFNSTTANKLLVMIDGRSVYTPLYSGVFWDIQDVMLEDIDRIEVVSGPGGTLWGSNAVNGVINIITRKSSETQGGLLAADGNDERGGAIRYGSKIDDDTSFRIYGKGFDRSNTFRSNRDVSARNSWNKEQVGFRLDGGKPYGKFTVQGDGYTGTIDQVASDGQLMSGGNLLGRWDGVLDNGSALQIQSYYDRTFREVPGTYEEIRDTFDVSAQHGFTPAQDHQVVWGGGYRYSMDAVTNSTGLAFLPADRNLGLANIFAQDTIALTESLDLTLGGKLEHNSYTGLEFLWNTRLAWELSDQSLLWSSVSRAVRTPSRLDRDLFSPGSPPHILLGGPNFESETLMAYEIGYRAQPSPRATYSISTYYNDYDELRSLEPTTAASLPVVIANKMEGSTYGVETWGSYRALDWWTLKAGANVMKKNLTLEDGSRNSSGTTAAGNDPSYQLSLRSMMSLPHNTEFDVAVRSIDTLSSPKVSDYTELDLRLGWRVAPDVELSLAAFNLLDAEHPEFGAFASRNEIGRSVFLKLQWIFPVKTPIAKIRTHLTDAVIVVLGLGLASAHATAADQSLEYGVKAAFLAKFGLFVEWPETTFRSPNQPFLLCVLGDDPFGSTVDKISGQQAVKGRKIEVRRLKSVGKDSGCQILYVATSESARLRPILETVRGTGTLTVTDGRPPAEPAGMINFVIKEDRVRFDIDEDTAAQNGLLISSTLLGLAVSVKRRQSPGVR